MTFNLTTFDAALQAKLNTANVNLSAQDYLLLTKAVAAAIEVSEGVSLIDLKGTANGVAGLDGTGNVPISQLLNAIPSQGTNFGKFLSTNGTNTFWATVDAFPSQSGNSGKILTTNGTAVSWTNTTTLASLSTTGDITSGDQLYVGAGASGFETSGTLTGAMAIFRKAGGANSFAQLAVQNATATSSTDIIAYMNNGNDSNGWMGMGIAGSDFDDTTYGITSPGDGYIFHNAIDNTYLGNMVFATGAEGSENKIIFAAGGFDSGTTQMEITPGQNVHIEIPTPSTSPTTGALTVVGGVGISGDVNINGSITFGGESSSLETTTLAVSDPLIFVGNGNLTDAVDLGLIAEYATSTSTITKAISNKALTSNVATLTTSTTHGFAVGDIVVVSTVDATFNGTYVVKAVPTTTTFTYDKINANVTSAAVSPAGSAEVTTKRRFAGVIRDSSDGLVKFFKDATTKPTNTVNLSEAGASYAGIVVGSATIGSVTNTEIGYLSGVTGAIQTQIETLTTNIGLKSNSNSPTFTGTVTTPLTTAGYVTTTSGGVIGSVSTIPNSGLTNSTITLNGTSVSLGGSAIIKGESFHPFLLMGA